MRIIASGYFQCGFCFSSCLSCQSVFIPLSRQVIVVTFKRKESLHESHNVLSNSEKLIKLFLQ